MIGFVKSIDSIIQVSFINAMNLSITLNIINVIYFTKVMKLVVVMNLITNIQFLKVMKFIRLDSRRNPSE